MQIRRERACFPSTVTLNYIVLVLSLCSWRSPRVHTLMDLKEMARQNRAELDGAHHTSDDTRSSGKGAVESISHR